AYVTLEPCAHTGETPPCAEALVAAGIGRAVVATIDPDPRVAGRGIARLEAAGIAVETGVAQAEAAEVNAGFLLRLAAGRPLVTLKLATTLDGRIATRAGESRWITGEAAREWAHAMRARHDAIMVGIGTALADDPMLTCRLPGLPRRPPVRVVVDGRMRLPLTSKLVETASALPTWLVTRVAKHERAERARARAYREAGVELLEVPADTADRPPAKLILELLARRGITRVLVEGGSHLAAALLADDVVDRIAWFRAAAVMGGDGVPAVAAFGVDRLDLMARFERVSAREVGPDVLESYRRRA
ncbi:MAG: bifunctional diaminohydroxyphosphoribosylaminopyrimidine deaminase/5-amino-6-(5-phosphoribosylamino)uracil reductase RibD, partial [Alphaproteobacteria bacterium]